MRTRCRELRRDMETGIRDLLQKFSDHSTCMEQEELLKFRQQLQSVEEEIKKERAVLSSQQQAQVERMVCGNWLATGSCAHSSITPVADYIRQ